MKIHLDANPGTLWARRRRARAQKGGGTVRTWCGRFVSPERSRQRLTKAVDCMPCAGGFLVSVRKRWEK